MDRSDIVIVLAEDDSGHRRLIEKNLRAIITNPLVRFSNGKDALDYLRSEEQASQQHLLLLDLNMPVMDGYQVLRRLKADPRTALIPVIVLTTADNPEEIQRCYDLGCNACVVKSADQGQFTETMRRLGLFLTIARMPRERTASRAVSGVPCRIGLTVSKPAAWSPF
ncbi:MAG TPA: response regulator [Bryobacteraceae bacterium]|nr:response regulator [Bryobacteraceae bacterium]